MQARQEIAEITGANYTLLNQFEIKELGKSEEIEKELFGMYDKYVNQICSILMNREWKPE